MNIKIHHFFDMIRDFGSGKEIVPHPHLHAYHRVAERIRNDATVQLELVVGADEVCSTCTHLIENKCIDIIIHRTDFADKEDFNLHLDQRIMEVCGLVSNKKYTPKILCEFANQYIDNIEFIYEGNDLPHTLQRKENVMMGLNYYNSKHKLNLNGI